MARNEEKHYCRLNRLLLEKQRKEYDELHPKRPKLEFLETADEIKQWIPSIKSDINFYLKKSQVVCYSDDHVDEARLMVSKLEKEFRAFLRKLRQLSPGLSAIPWTERNYESKNKDVKPEVYVPGASFVPIPTPLLDLEENKPVVQVEEKSEMTPFVMPYLPSMDLPLQFTVPLPSSVENSFVDSSKPQIHRECKLDIHVSDKQLHFSSNECIKADYHSKNITSSSNDYKLRAMTDDQKDAFHHSRPENTVKNVLGLDYSSSSEEET